MFAAAPKNRGRAKFLRIIGGCALSAASANGSKPTTVESVATFIVCRQKQHGRASPTLPIAPRILWLPAPAIQNKGGPRALCAVVKCLRYMTCGVSRGGGVLAGPAVTVVMLHHRLSTACFGVVEKRLPFAEVSPTMGRGRVMASPLVLRGWRAPATKSDRDLAREVRELR